jgi:hippurate hydrolase
MLHVLTAVELPSGVAVVSSGGVSAPAADYFTMEVQGKSCHGSAPWKGVDALSIAARILLGLQEISAREVSPADAAVLTVGSLQAGKAGNVLCDKAILQGTLRSFDEKTRGFIKIRMEKIAKQTAMAFRARAKITYGGGCPTLINDGEFSEKVLVTAKKLLGKNSVFVSRELGGNIRKNSGGSEDFAYISHAVPSVMIALAAGEKGKGYEYPLHHAKVKFDESALCIGAALYAAVAQDVLN